MTSKIKNTTIVCGLVLIVCLVLGVFLTATPSNMAYAATTELTKSNCDEEFIVTDTANEVLAEFNYIRISENECNVSIANKSTATKALIPDSAEIDGKKYTVTEVAANGFASSPNLARVSLPPTIKKIGNSAFANCAVLSRVALANVKEIGNNAFFRCPELANLFLPKSVEVVGSSILRNNNTQVYVRALTVGNNWSANWNTNNSNQNVVFNSKDKEPMELCTIYSDIVTYSAEAPAVVGYALDGGQPRTDEFYRTDENNNIFIPREYNGVRISQIHEYAFSYSSFSQFIVEYSKEEITISSSAFWGAEGTSVTINRPVQFYDIDNDSLAENVFTESTLEAIVLPNNITEITDTMFYDCKNLTNIFFEDPIDCSVNESLNIVKNLLYTQTESEEEVRVPAVVYLPETIERIGESAFYATTKIKEIHIYSSVGNVGAQVFANWLLCQTIIVHNETDYEQWHPDWLANTNAEVKYTVATYAITFHFDDEIGTTETMVIKYGHSIGVMPKPQKEYNYFDSWVDSSKQTWAENSYYNIEGDLDLYPQYTPFKLRVKYNGNSPNEIEDPVQGSMAETVLDFNATLVLGELGYSIRGWDFENWSVKDGNRTMTFNYKDEISVTMLKLFQYFDLDVEDRNSITLYANWKLREYKISYEPYEGTLPNGNPDKFTIKTPTFKFAPPIREGYIGTWDPEGIEKGSTVEDITVTASYRLNTLFEVSYDLEGILESENPQYFNTEEDNPLNNPTRSGYSFIGWRVKGTADRFVTNLKGLENNVILETVWVQTGKEYTVTSTTTTVTVDSAISSIEIQNSYCNLEIIVPTNVNQLYLYARTNTTYLVRLTIQKGRTTNFTLILNNIGLCSSNPIYPTIDMKDKNSLNIIAYKSSTIQGATGINGANGREIDNNLGLISDATEGGKGGLAIKCTHLTICSPITILGGMGGRGGNGASGLRGYNGAIGGEGNYAIVAQKITINSADVVIRGGNGGSGGSGGSGLTSNGTGALGGLGSRATSILDSTIDYEASTVENLNDYANVVIARGTRGTRGADGGEFHETIM